MLAALLLASRGGPPQSKPFELHAADSMTQVRRDWLPFQQGAVSSDNMLIHMAKNEFEAGQAVISVPSFASTPLRGAQWTIAELVGPGGASIPAEDISVVPVGYVFGGPCPFDARGGGRPSGGSAACPQGRPFRCILGDAANDTERCVAAGFPECNGPGGECIPGGIHNSSVQCIGCSVSQGSVNFYNGYSFSDPQNWWPIVLLDTVKTFDVAVGTAQSLLVTIRTGADTAPGLYQAVLAVYAKGVQHLDVMVEVTVHDFALPVAQPTTLWGQEVAEYNPAFAHAEGEPTHTVNVSAYAAMMTDHRMPGGSGIYHDNYMNISDTTALKALWTAGQRLAIVAAFTDCQSPTVPAYSGSGCEFAKRLTRMVAVADAYKEAGWPEENLYVYMVDEASFHAELWRNTSQQVKNKLPKAQVVVLGNNAWVALAGGCVGAANGAAITCPATDWSPANLSQLEAGGAYEYVDLFIPRMATFVKTSATTIATIRKTKTAGGGPNRRVGWYTSGAPAGTYSLNTFAEFSSLRARMMLGAGAWKMKTDAYLYYAMNGWGQYSKGIPVSSQPISRCVCIYGSILTDCLSSTTVELGRCDG